MRVQSARALESRPCRVVAARRGLLRNGEMAARYEGNRHCDPAGGSSSGRRAREIGIREAAIEESARVQSTEESHDFRVFREC